MNKKLLIIVFLLIFIQVIALIGWYFFQKQKVSKPAEYFCPVPKEYCNTARELTFENKYFGLGYSLPLDTPVYAMFEGKFSDGVMMLVPQIGGETYPIYSLTKPDKSIIVTYLSSDTKPFVDNTISRGQEIFRLSGNSVASSSSNLIIMVNRLTNNKSEIIRLSPKEFGNE